MASCLERSCTNHGRLPGSPPACAESSPSPPPSCPASAASCPRCSAASRAPPARGTSHSDNPKRAPAQEIVPAASAGGGRMAQGGGAREQTAAYSHHAVLPAHGTRQKHDGHPQPQPLAPHPPTAFNPQTPAPTHTPCESSRAPVRVEARERCRVWGGMGMRAGWAFWPQSLLGCPRPRLGLLVRRGVCVTSSRGFVP